MIGIMLMITVMIVAFTLITPIKELVTTARDADNLDCVNTTISVGTRITCVIVDITMPYYIGMILFAAAGFLFLKGRSQSLPQQL